MSGPRPTLRVTRKELAAIRRLVSSGTHCCANRRCRSIATHILNQGIRYPYYCDADAPEGAEELGYARHVRTYEAMLKRLSPPKPAP